MKIRDGGYKLRLDAIPFQSAKSCSEILSDVSVHFFVWLKKTWLQVNVPDLSS